LHGAQLQIDGGSAGAQLSGGEQQMLSIGRALMTHTELIVADIRHSQAIWGFDWFWRNFF
jgi:ABC-type branched-subunit amino acid transport system ATPase component